MNTLGSIVFLKVVRGAGRLPPRISGARERDSGMTLFFCLLPPGPYSLNGYRVRVYRQDSATQWFTGIITHHDLFSRNMVVMNDQVRLNKGLTCDENTLHMDV